MPTSTTRTVVSKSLASLTPLLLALFVCAAQPARAPAQTTAFTYQGQLTEAGTGANGSYDMQFTLFDIAAGGVQLGPAQAVPTVPVSNGLFTVQLDFGVNAFPGANRFLEIGVRPAGGSGFQTLAPRQQISSTPYAIRTLSAATADMLSSTCTGCVQDTQIQSVAGSKVTGTIPVASVPGGSTDYIQNGMTQQPNSNFNISGDGFIAGNLTAGGTLSGFFVNATAQYNIGGTRVLSTAGSENLFAGALAGTNGFRNAFFGREAGSANASGTNNVFVGFQAGGSNTMGGFNTFVGSRSGPSNTTGVSNTFVGDGAGGANGSGARNSFFGEAAGALNTTGIRNSFFGVTAGFSNTTGNENTLIGHAATTVGSTTLTNATAIGANAAVAQSNSLVLGSTAGVVGGSKTNVGIGTTTPLHLLQIGGGFDGHLGFDGSDGSPNAGSIRFGDSTGWKLHLGRARQSSGGALNTGATGAIMTLVDSGRVGIGTVSPDATLSVVGTASKSGGGSWASFSDERLKTIKGPFTGGLDAVMQLQPVRYAYTPDNALGLPSSGEHIGFGAHAVQQVIPEAVTKNDQGYLLVNNDPILWTMLNAIKEQQHEIEQLKGEVRQLRAASAGRHVSDRQRSGRYEAQ